LHTHSLPVIRRYEYHNVAYYVVRQTDGMPLEVPDWTTRPEAANAKIVSIALLDCWLR